MKELANYILSVTAAAVIVSIGASLFSEKSSAGTIVRMVGGLFLTFIMLSPVTDWNFELVSSFAHTYAAVGEEAAGKGQELAEEKTREIITGKTCAYILDKAETLHAQLTVQVILSDEELPVPERIYLTGQVSPYARSMLQQLIEEKLGVPKERQIWTG